jgi:alginate O-acetyltransferase complex protein AlgI
MIFTSFNFLVFFPVVALLFYLTPMKWRWVTLLAASLFFYINIKPVYALLLAGVILSTYVFTRLISNTGNESRKTFYLVCNILLVLFPLVFYKYFSVINNAMIQFMENWNLRWPLPEIKYMLPIGISFYTFMAVGYTIDVHNEELDAERNIGLVALFISFFPLILSGPIERAKNMIPQFRDFRPINYENITAGLKLMLWGYFMKLVVADRLGIYVDLIYGNVAGNNGSSLLIASILYPFQVYTDLGGYSLIAIGVARVMGLNVMQNFNRPFFATSMAEFWRRWHISLISWLTDYVYNPLSFRFRKYKVWGIVIALMLTFFISGIWHGAAMTFVVWGVLQGTFLSIEALANRKKTELEKKYNLSNTFLYSMAGMLLVFIMFSVSQVFAKSENINQSLLIFHKFFQSTGHPYIDFTTMVYAFFGLLILFIKDYKDEFNVKRIRLFQEKHIHRQLSYVILLYIILLMGVFNGTESFIYFKF